MSRFPILLLLTIIIVAVTAGCSGSSSVPYGDLKLSVPAGFGGVLNMAEALAVSASGLQPMEWPVLIDVLNSSNAIVSKAQLTADRNGRIDDVILSYDVGMTGASGGGKLAPGVYTVRITASAGTAEVQVTVAANPSGPCVWASDIDGDLANAFLNGDPVFVQADGLVPGRSYRIWPVEDRRSWNNGDQIHSWQMDNPSAVWPPEIPEYIEVTADSAGKIDNVQLLPYATNKIPGVTDQFDVVLDASPFSVFNSSTDAVDGAIPTGVVVKVELPEGAINAQLGSKKDYEYSNSYLAGDDIYIWLNPAVLIPIYSNFVTKYIVAHIEEWIDGMTIEDITQGPEIDPVQDGCTNEGLILAWVDAKKGLYDIILDLNSNGIYDEGTDIVDGGAGGAGFVVN